MKRAREVDDPARPPADDAVSDPVDEASALSFPASDPPGWIVVHPGQPAAPAESGGPDRSPVRRRFSNPPDRADPSHSAGDFGRCRIRS